MRVFSLISVVLAGYATVTERTVQAERDMDARFEYTGPACERLYQKVRISGATAYCSWTPSAAPACTVGSERADV